MTKIKDTRYFNGKLYHYQQSTKSKKFAKKAKKHYKSLGYKSRVAKIKGGYSIYKR